MTKFERTSFERTFKLGFHSKERYFSTKTQFVKTTDEFWKNVIRSNDLPRFIRLSWLLITIKYHNEVLNVRFCLKTKQLGAPLIGEHYRKSKIIFTLGCYAMTAEDEIFEKPVLASSIKDPKSFCWSECRKAGHRFFVLIQNSTCTCIQKVPLGGKLQIIPPKKFLYHSFLSCWTKL